MLYCGLENILIYQHLVLMFYQFQAGDIDEELDLEGRPSRFSRVEIPSNQQGDSETGTIEPNADKRKEAQKNNRSSKKWRKTGMKALSVDFRDTF